MPQLLAEVAAGEAEVYYFDGVHPTHNTKTGRGWIRKGTDFDIDCNSGRKRVNINGEVRATKPEHVVYDVAESINAQSTSECVANYSKSIPQKRFIKSVIMTVTIAVSGYKNGPMSSALNLCFYHRIRPI